MKKKNKKKAPKLVLGLPALRAGEGSEILKDKTEMPIVLPMNSFYIMWEAIEAIHKKNERYKKGPLAHVYEASDLAVKECRSAFYRTTIGSMYLNRAKLAHEAALAAAAKDRPKGKDKKKEPENEPELILCGAKHQDDDGKTRKCRRKPAHKGQHKDKKGNRW